MLMKEMCLQFCTTLSPLCVSGVRSSSVVLGGW